MKIQDEEVDPEVRPEIILQMVEQERQMWLNTRELWQIRVRVYARLKDDAGKENATKEMEKCEMALTEIRRIMKEARARTVIPKIPKAEE